MGAPMTSFDVVVIGAGYAGLMAALTLAQEGRAVGLIDRLPIGGNLPPTPGENQSSISGGHVTYGFSQDYSDLARRYGQEFAQSLLHVSIDGVDLVERTCTAYGIEDAAFRRGYLILPRNAREWHALERAHAAIRPMMPMDTSDYLLDSSAVRARLSSPEFTFGGLFSSIHGQIEPREYVLGLARAARACGVTIIDQTLIGAVRFVNSGYEAISATGDVFRAPKMIVCGGSYLLQQSLFPELRSYQAVIGNYAIKTEPLPARIIDALFPSGYSGAFADMRRTNVLYARLDSLNRLDFGASCFSDPLPNARVVETMMYRTFPVLAEASIKVQAGRFGRLSGSLNEIAQIFRPERSSLSLSSDSSSFPLTPSVKFDPDQDGFILISALGSEGINMGTTVGQAAAHAFMGRADVLNLFSVIRHRRLPVTFPWEPANRWRDRVFGDALRVIDHAASGDDVMGALARAIADRI